MQDRIVFYHNPLSRGRIAHWMLEEIGAPYEVKLLRFDRREHKTPEFLRVNPMGKIPAIVHRGVAVTEAPAICAYLADAFPAVGLAPALDDPRRGIYLRWMFFGAGCVEPALVDKMLERPASKPGSVGYGTYEDTMAALEGAVADGWILGDRFSAADVYIGSQIGWGMMTKSIDDRPVFRAYFERCSARPAHVRMTEQNARLAAELQS